MIIPLCAAALAVLLLLWLFLSRKKSILRVLLPLAAAAVLLTGGIALAGPAVFLPAAQEEENRYPPGFDPSVIPPYEDLPYYIVNDNQPFLTERTETSFENYSPLDRLGRCGMAYACVGPETVPTEKRGSIGMIKPTGWHTIKYDFIGGKYLYNRCHLIAYCLSGENANPENLITGTRYLNQEMEPIENEVREYIEETGHHVMYRVTPVFEGDNLVASGVLMEGQSVEDDEIVFCIYMYNFQPGVIIDYATGDSQADPNPDRTVPASGTDTDDPDPEETEPVSDPDAAGAAAEAETAQDDGESPEQGEEQIIELEIRDTEEDSGSRSAGMDEGSPSGEAAEQEYVLNRNTRRFHRPECPSVQHMKEKNRISFTGSREELLGQGYEPCQNCNP